MRRPHQKSRLGCADCRLRHIKCDEEKPKCRQCVRRDVPCLYPPAATTTTTTTTKLRSSLDGDVGVHPIQPFPTPESSGAGSAVSPATPLAPSPSNGTSATTRFTTRELAWLHHWTMRTSKDMVHDHPDLLHFWQSLFPQVGFSFPFALSGIFSLATLHRAHTDPDQRRQLVAEAASYHQAMMHGFTQAMAGDREDTSEGLFTCLCLNNIYIFARYGWIADAGEGDASRKSRILGFDWMPSMRAVNTALHPLNHLIVHGSLAPLAHLFHLVPWETMSLDDCQSDDDGIFRRLSLIWADDAGRETYETMLKLFRKIYAFVTKCEISETDTQRGYRPLAVTGPILCILLSSDEYVSLLAQRQPPALVMFAFIGSLFHRVDDFWFMKGWGRSIVETVDELLGDYWRSWTEWPREFTRRNHGLQIERNRKATTPEYSALWANAP